MSNILWMCHNTYLKHISVVFLAFIMIPLALWFSKMFLWISNNFLPFFSICKLIWSSVWRNHRLLPRWSDQAFLLFNLSLTVWIYKLSRTPVFACWTPHVRRYLSSLSEQNAKSEKCDVVETPTLDPWPSHVSVVHMTRIWTYFLPLKDWDWKSKQLQTLTFFFFFFYSKFFFVWEPSDSEM